VIANQKYQVDQYLSAKIDKEAEEKLKNRNKPKQTFISQTNGGPSLNKNSNKSTRITVIAIFPLSQHFGKIISIRATKNAEFVRTEYFHVNKLINNGKKVFLKAPLTR
jgi:hypothetical protein